MTPLKPGEYPVRSIQDSWVEARVRKRKTVLYLRKHGFIRLKCTICGNIFTCSGHCLMKRKLHMFESEGCLCGNCDNSKNELGESGLGWFELCRKTDPILLWIREVSLAKKNAAE